MQITDAAALSTALNTARDTARVTALNTALDAVADARARLGRVGDDLGLLRGGAADLAERTAWSSRAAEGFRERVARWHDDVGACILDVRAMEAELRAIAARLEVERAAAGLS